jgi:hypothetical protein
MFLNQPRNWSECLDVARVSLTGRLGVAERPEPSIGGCVKLDKRTNRGVYPLVNTLRLLLARHKTTRNVLGVF